MSTPAQKANLARIRDNQRRSRARKREYLQELEQRVRLADLQGIEASAEVQVAARRVAEENRHLRALLNKQGLGNDYIDHYVASSMPPDELTPFSAPPGNSVPALEQVLAPRRPNQHDHSAPFPLPGQASRETSITSASTSTSSLWEASQSSSQMQTPQQQPQQVLTYHPAMTMPPSMSVSSDGGHAFSSPVYGGEATPRIDGYQNHPSDGILENAHQAVYAPQQQQQQQQQQQHLHPNVHGAPPMGYGDPNAPFKPDPHDYGPPGGYC